MPDLTARLLAEIERRERPAEFRRKYSDDAHAGEMLTYLAALREIVELHRAVERDTATSSRTCQECAPLMWPCATLGAVATALGVDIADA